jgi:hypothetical protein
MSVAQIRTSVVKVHASTSLATTGVFAHMENVDASVLMMTHAL